MKQIRVAVIGVGYLGQFHARKYAAMQGVRLVGVADIDPERARRIGAENQAKPFADYRPLLNQVDAVSIVVPTEHHHQVARDCLTYGKDILVEKPITATIAEADDLIRLARRQNCILQVGHLERFNPAIQAIQPLLRQPLFIEAHRIAPFKDRGTDVDVVLDLMIHDIDIILSVVKSSITSMHTVGAPVITPLTDIANARLIFASGCTANVTVSRISMEEIRRLRIFQPGQYIAVDFSKKEYMTIRLNNAETTIPKPDIQRASFPEQDTLELELRDFISNVRQRRQPAVAGPEGREALRIALEVVTQIKENRHKLEARLGRQMDLSGLD